MPKYSQNFVVTLFWVYSTHLYIHELNDSCHTTHEPLYVTYWLIEHSTLHSIRYGNLRASVTSVTEKCHVRYGYCADTKLFFKSKSLVYCLSWCSNGEFKIWTPPVGTACDRVSECTYCITDVTMITKEAKLKVGQKFLSWLNFFTVVHNIHSLSLEEYEFQYFLQLHTTRFEVIMKTLKTGIVLYINLRLLWTNLRKKTILWSKNDFIFRKLWILSIKWQRSLSEHIFFYLKVDLSVEWAEWLIG